MIQRIAKHIARQLARLTLRAHARTREEMRRVWERAGTICVLCAGGIGDAIMATPLVEEIRRRRPGARIIIVGKRATAQVFENAPGIDRVLAYTHDARSFLGMLRLLRAERADIVFGAQPSNTIRHALIAGLSGAPVRLKHERDYSANPEGDFSFVYSTLLPTSMATHRVELNLEMLRFLGEDIPRDAARPSMHVREETRRRIRGWLGENGYDTGRSPLVAIHPGGGRPDKLWPADRFAAVGRWLRDRGLTVCVLGGGEEKMLGDEIVRAIGPGAIDAAGHFTLEESGALLMECRALLSNDSGIMHLAVAVGTPVIAIFGQTDPRHIGPRASDSIVLRSSDDVRSVSVEDVIEALGER